MLTNTPPRFAQRAPGGAQITAMLEPLLDAAAEKLGVDRLEMRRLNAPDSSSKFDGNQGPLTSALVREAIDKTKTLVDWDNVKKLSRQKKGTKVTGVGVALSSYTAGALGFDGLMVLRPDGKLELHTGVGNLGTHSFSDTARTAAEVLDFPWEKVELIWGNTSKGLPWTSVQAGSMTTHSATRAIHAASMDLKKKLQEIAAKDLGGSPDAYEVSNERVHRKGAPGSGMTLAKAAERAIALGGKFDGHELPEDINPYTKGGAQVVVGKGAVGVAKDNYERRRLDLLVRGRLRPGRDRHRDRRRRDHGLRRGDRLRPRHEPAQPGGAAPRRRHPGLRHGAGPEVDLRSAVGAVVHAPLLQRAAALHPRRALGAQGRLRQRARPAHPGGRQGHRRAAGRRR